MKRCASPTQHLRGSPRSSPHAGDLLGQPSNWAPVGGFRDNLSVSPLTV